MGERHAEWCRTITERDIQPFLEGTEKPGAGWRLAEEQDNVIAGIQFARGSGRGELALRLAHAAGLYWYFTSTNLGVGLSELDATLTTFTSPPAAWAATACSAGWLAAELGRFDDARRHGEAALRLRSEMDSTRVEIETLNLLGTCEPDPRRGRAHFEDVISVAQKAGLRTQVMNALMNLGSRAMEQGSLVEARERLAEALEIADDYSDSHLKPWIAFNLAVAGALDGDPRSSLAHLDDALHGDAGATMAMHACAVMALAAAQLGNHGACARLLGVVDAIRDDTGLVLQPLESNVAERAQAISIAALGESFDGEREHGRSTPVGAAAAFALERAEELAMAA